LIVRRVCGRGEHGGKRDNTKTSHGGGVVAIELCNDPKSAQNGGDREDRKGGTGVAVWARGTKSHIPQKRGQQNQTAGSICKMTGNCWADTGIKFSHTPRWVKTSR